MLNPKMSASLIVSSGVIAHVEDAILTVRDVVLYLGTLQLRIGVFGTERIERGK